MAASMWRIASRSVKLCTQGFNYSVRRYLLSEAYGCRESWVKRLSWPALQKVDKSEFAIQLQEQFDKENRASRLDMEILVNKLHEVEADDLPYFENLLYRFRHCNDFFENADSYIYTVIRGYLDLGQSERLLKIIISRSRYGLIPSCYAANIIMDHFIQQENYADGARIASEMMLQEDFSHELTFLLSLFCAVKHLQTRPPDEPIGEPPPDTSEEDWIPVKFITRPFYDNHFDIVEERFLLGKTLWYLGRELNDVIGRTLQVVGLAMWEKFDEALQLLESWRASEDKTILEEALHRFKTALDMAATRDPNDPDKELGYFVMEDDIRSHRVTSDDKERYTAQLQELTESWQSSGRVVNGNLLALVEDMVKPNIGALEQADIDAQKELFSKWIQQRTDLQERLEKMALIKEKKKEIAAKLKELQDKEELLNFFDDRTQILLAKSKAPKLEKAAEDQLEYVEDIMSRRRANRKMVRERLQKIKL